MDEGYGERTEDAVGVPERGGEPMDDGSAPSPKGIPPIAEALGYIGGALALSAVIALLATFWSQLGPMGHFGIGAALAVAGLLGGFLLERSEGAAAQRLAHFLLFAGVAGVGVTAGFAVRDALLSYTSAARADANDWGWFIGAAAVALSGGLVWWRTRTVLQHLAFGLGVAAAALLVLPLIPIDGPDWGVGATLVVVALVWGGFALKGWLEPRVVGLVLAALGIAGGVEFMALATSPMLMWAVWLGIAACASLIWAGSRLEQLGVLGVGTVGLMVFSGEAIGEYWGFGVGTAIALIAFGFALLGVGVRMTIGVTEEASPARRIVAEVAGYLGVALAMGGAGVLMADSWDELGIIGRIVVPLVGSGVAYASAAVLARGESATARRLSQTLLAIGVLAAAIAVAMVAQPIAENVVGLAGNSLDNWTTLAGAVTATLLGGVTWWLRKGSLTQLAFMGGVVTILINSLNFAALDRLVPMWAFGSAFVAVGTLWVVLGAGERLYPARTALALGSIVTLQGLQIMVISDDGFNTWAALLGIAFGVAAIAASIYLKRATLLGFGAVGIVVFTMMTVMERFGGRAAAPILLLAMGVVFIAIAVVVVFAAPRMRRAAKPPGLPKNPLSQA